MTLHTFRLLSPVAQLYWLLKHGTYLAQRCEDEGGANLYYCADQGRGFFVEVGVALEQPLVLRSFVSSVPLEEYAVYMRLPEWGA